MLLIKNLDRVSTTHNPHLGCPHRRSLLFFVNVFSAGGLAFGVGTFARRCHGLAIFGYNRPIRRMVLPASLLRFGCEGVGVDLFDRDGVPSSHSPELLDRPGRKSRKIKPRAFSAGYDRHTRRTAAVSLGPILRGTTKPRIQAIVSYRRSLPASFRNTSVEPHRAA
jgi:hypothetical protein